MKKAFDHLFYSFAVITSFSSLVLASSSNRRNVNQSIPATSRPSTSSSSFVDEILSRPVMNLPEIYQHEQIGSSIDSTSSLSKSQVKAIYQDYMRDAQNKRQQTQLEASVEDQETEEEYDFEGEVYGSDLEEEEDDSQDDPVRDLSNDFAYLSSTKSSRLTPEEDEANKRLFEKGWKARHLSCDMDARDLAMGVVKMKVDLLEYNMASTMGMLASKHVKRYKNRKYWSQYRFWARRYTSILEHKEESIQNKEILTGIEVPLEEKKRILWKRIGTAQMKTYDDWKEHSKKQIFPTEVLAMKKAKLAGKVIESIARDASGNDDLKIEELSIAEIEYYSRSLNLDYTIPKEERISKESVKRYLRKCLDKSLNDVDEFSRLRLDYKVNYFAQKQNEEYAQRKIAQRKNRN